MIKKLTIFGKTYDVKIADKVDDDNSIADIRYNKSLITIRSDVDTQTKRISLLHEFVHGALTAVGIYQHDEAMVETMAQAINQLIPQILPMYKELNNEKTKN